MQMPKVVDYSWMNEQMARKINDELEEGEVRIVHQMAVASADERHLDSTECWCKPVNLGTDPSYGGATVFFHRVVH